VLLWDALNENSMFYPEIEVDTITLDPFYCILALYNVNAVEN
jgi:hypothetical protein